MRARMTREQAAYNIECKIQQLREHQRICNHRIEDNISNCLDCFYNQMIKENYRLRKEIELDEVKIQRLILKLSRI